MNAKTNTIASTTSTVHTALKYGATVAKYPGAWTEWDGMESLDQFILGLHKRPAEDVRDAAGRVSGRKREAGPEALRAIPYIYRGATQYLMARHALSAMGIGAEVNVIETARKMHQNLDLMRAFFAAHKQSRIDGDFAEATTMIEVVPTMSWQEVGDNDGSSTGEGSKMFVSCSLEEALDVFIEELMANGDRLTNAQFTLLDVAAREVITDRSYDGWEKVAMDGMQDNLSGSAKEQRQKFRTGLMAKGTKRFYAVNKLYRLLVKEKRVLIGTMNHLQQLKERATRFAQRPVSEQYAGGSEDEQIRLGRVDHWMASNDTTGMDGFDPGHRYTEAVMVGESELADLEELLAELEEQQMVLNPVWKVINRRGAPYWYANQNEFYTIEEKEQADERRMELRDQWLRDRQSKFVQGLDDKALAMLAELANFDS